MKILVVWVDFCDYLEGIRSTFIKLGCECDTWYPSEYKQYPSKFDKRMAKIGFGKYVKSIGYEEYYHSEQLKILSKVDEFKPDITMILNAGGQLKGITTTEVVRHIKSKGSKTILWFVDSIRNFPEIDQEHLEAYDVVYSFEEEDIGLIKNKYNIEANLLYLGAIADLYVSNNIFQTIYDVSFVGGVDKKRLETLERVAEYCVKNDRKMAFYGPVGDKKKELEIANNYKNLYQFINNGFLPAKDVAALYKKTKINLNITLGKSYGINARTFEILAAGGFQIADNKNIGKTLLIDRQHLAIYDGADHLINLIDYYLKNDDARRVVAKNGEDLVKKEYLSTKILGRILTDVN